MMSSVTELHRPVDEWACSGVPLTAFFNIERRHGKNKPVIKKALVELDSLPFATLAEQRHAWALRDAYRNPGPIQLHGSGARVELCHTLALEYKERAAGARAGAAGAAAPPGLEGAAAPEAYAAILAALLARGAAASAADLNRALFFRLAHGVTDALHSEALARAGSSDAAFAAIEAAVRLAAAK